MLQTLSVLMMLGLLSRHPHMPPCVNALLYTGTRDNPAAGFSLRAIDPERYQIVNEAADGAVIEEIEESKAFFEVYDGAVYLYQARQCAVLCQRGARCWCTKLAAPMLCSSLLSSGTAAMSRAVVERKARGKYLVWFSDSAGAGARSQQTMVSAVSVMGPWGFAGEDLPVQEAGPGSARGSRAAGRPQVLHQDARLHRRARAGPARRIRAQCAPRSPGGAQGLRALHGWQGRCFCLWLHLPHCGTVVEAEGPNCAAAGFAPLVGWGSSATASLLVTSALRVQHVVGLREALQAHNKPWRLGGWSPRAAWARAPHPAGCSAVCGAVQGAAGVGDKATSAAVGDCLVTTRWLGFHRIWQGSGEVFDTVDLFLPDMQLRTQARSHFHLERVACRRAASCCPYDTHKWRYNILQSLRAWSEWGWVVGLLDMPSVWRAPARMWEVQAAYVGMPASCGLQCT